MRPYFFLLVLITLTIRMSGQGAWYLGAGTTFLVPSRDMGSEIENYRESVAVSPFRTMELDATGRFGFFGELGRTWINRDRRLIHGIELGIHYKSFNGREVLVATTNEIDPQNYFHEIHHRTNYVGLDVNLIHEIDWTKKLIWRHMLGLNGEYGFTGDRTVLDSTSLIPPSPDREILAQLHYRLGLVIHTNSRWSFMPSIETPVLNGYPWSNGRSTLEIWNFRYRPLILSVRIMYGDKRKSSMDKGCLEIPENRERPELWDKEMRKYRRAKNK